MREARLPFARGCATSRSFVTKGDLPGHEFHGNQWTGPNASELNSLGVKPEHIDAWDRLNATHARFGEYEREQNPGARAAVGRARNAYFRSGLSHRATQIISQLKPLHKNEVDDAAHDAATSPYNASRNPTRGQASAGNYRKGHIKISGLQITIENPAGSHRRPEWPALGSHYGYIRGTEGADGDHVDVFVRPGIDAEYEGPVFVVDQLDEKGNFDEHKVMLGWTSEELAAAAYLENFTPGWKAGPLTEFTIEEFKDWLNGDATQPIAKGDVSGHEFHGNQWTGGAGLGPKPTSSNAKGVKLKVAELLSSGHSFTSAELCQITGATEKTMKTALHILGSEKYSAIHNVPLLNIVKEKDGTFHLGGAPKTDATSKPVSAEKPVGTGKLQTSELGPKLSKEEADTKYKAAITKALDDIKSSNNVEKASKEFKNAKAVAMAQWAQDTTGTKQDVKPQQVFPADEKLVADIWSGINHEKALENWKEETAFGKAKAAEELIKKEINSVNFDPSSTKPVGVGAYKATGKGLEGVPKQVLPASYAQITAEELGGNNLGKLNEQNRAELAKVDGPSSSDTKIDVCERLRAELIGSEKFQEMAKAIGGPKTGQASIESTLLACWANTSGDSNAKSVALQLSVRDVFGMSDEDISKKSFEILKSHDEDEVFAKAASSLASSPAGSGKTIDPALVREGLKEYVAAMYRATQADLAARGIKEFAVARGMDLDGPDGGTTMGQMVNVTLQPASSFSTDIAIARQTVFSGGDSIYLARVPASQVLSTYRSGFGCRTEREVVVLGAKGMVAARIGVDHLESNFFGKTAKLIYQHMGIKGMGNVTMSGGG